MAKLVSLPEIIQDIYVKLEESDQGGSGTGGNCSSNITIDTSTNTGTLNISDGSVLSTRVLNVENTPKAGRVTLTDKDNNSISFDAVTVEYLGKNFYTKTIVDEKLSEIGSSSYDDSALVGRVEALENKVDNDTIYDDSAILARVEALEAKQDNDTIYDDSLLNQRVEALENKSIKLYSVTIDNLVITANNRLNHQSSALSNFPEGWVIEAFKQISILKGTNATDEGWKKVIIQSFSTASNSTKPNISLYNFGDTDAVVKLTVQCLCQKNI